MVLMMKVLGDDPFNLLIRSQFGDWPKDRLAQIHASADPPGYGEFCGHYYRLQPRDRRLGSLFQRLRAGVFSMTTMDAVPRQDSCCPVGVQSRWAKEFKSQIAGWLVDSGFWELMFRVRLSQPMLEFIKDFEPDLIYCQGYSLGFATLPLLMAKRFGLPICFQTTDDWPSYTYRCFPTNWLLRHQARRLVTEAKVRLAFGEKMRRKFESRYGVSLHTTYHLDDPGRFPNGSRISTAPLQVIYAGSIGMRRYEAIQDLLSAIKALPDGNRAIKIAIYCSSFPKDTPRELFDSPEITVLPLPKHDDLPRILGSATVLFLPESFNVAPELIEYSISSKAHVYMMSGRPILVYGPAYSGTVEYAAEGGWAAVVTERNQELLKQALLRLLHNSRENAALKRKADACLRRNHNLTVGREQFRSLLAGAVSHDS